MFYICTKFCDNTLKGFRIIELTRFVTDGQPWKKKICLPQTGGDIIFYICTKFRENISYVIRVIERTQFVTDGQTVRQTDNHGKNNISPQDGGKHNKQSH